MTVEFMLNGRKVAAVIEADDSLFTVLRGLGMYSVKCGCETTNCGLCTVFLNDKPVLSCSVPAARADGCRVDTLEGLEEEAYEFGSFIAEQGAEQCGFCNPGMIMNAIALFRENPDPTVDEIKEYLACGEYADKAGAYGIQGGAALFAEKMVGDYYNVMGLPVCKLWQILHNIAPEILEG